MRVNITSNRIYWHPASCDVTRWVELSVTSLVFLPKMCNLNLTVRKHQTNQSWETFYKITNHTHHKHEGDGRWEKTITDQKRLGRHTLNAVSDPGLNLERGKGHYRKNRWDSNKVCSLINSIVPMLISLVLIIVLWLRKLLTLGKAGGKVYLNSLNYLCNFSVSLKLLQHFKKFGGFPRWSSD